MGIELKPISWFPFGAEYVDTMSTATAASPSFHYASLLTVAGAVLGRRVFYRHATILYPNFFTCLIGPSGVSYKGTCQKLGQRLYPELHKLSSIATMEGLLLHLQQWPQTLIVLEELSQVLKKSRQDYSAAIIPKLAELYDNPDLVEHPTKNNPIIIEKPSVSLLAATTPEWLESSMEKADIFGGLANRFSYVVGNPGQALPDPLLPSFSHLSKEMHRRLDRWKDNTALELDYEANELWGEVFCRWFEELKEQDELRRALAARNQDYVFKTAMVIHCLEAPSERSRLIDWQTLSSALGYVEYLKECLGVIRPIFSPLEEKVLAIVRRAGALRRSKLHIQVSGRVPGTELTKALSSLLKYHRIKEEDGMFSVDE